MGKGNLERQISDHVIAYKSKRKKAKGFRRIRLSAVTIAVALLALIVGVNSSPVFATTLMKVPIVGSIIKVETFKEYILNKDKFNADIKVPVIQGLNNKSLESSLNEKYLNEDKELYNQFMEEIKKLPKDSGAHLGIDSGYEVKTDNDDIYSIGRYVLTVAGSSNTVIKYDTIDKKKEILLTLPSLFKDDKYIDVISDNIITQMKEQMKTQEGKIYWIEGGVDSSFIDIFKKISKDQNFYINKNNKLVISFNQAEVAPAFMGTIEFTIPTEDISDILVGNEYIK